MAELEKQGTGAAGGAAQVEGTATTAGGAAIGEASGAPGPVPYERFKEVNEKANALEARLKALEDASKTAAEQELAEQKRWQELATAREAELKAERAARQRIEVAARKGLPPELANRLTGETPEALEKDADALLAYMKPKAGPGVPPGGGGAPQQLDLSKMSPEEIRQYATKHGLKTP